MKHTSLYLVMALSRILRLPAASGSGTRWALALQILVILVLSAITDRSGVWDGGTRHSGLFANPNNLALIPFLLLFLVARRDARVLHFAAHATVVGVLTLSRTSGAVIAYGAGLAYHLGGLLRRPWRLLAVALLSVSGLTLASLMVFADESLLPDTRLTKQLFVMRAELGTVLSGTPVAYYEQERVLGAGSASAIWRLAHWQKTVAIYADGSLMQRIAGFGLGSSPDYLGKLPHNDYLRVLFEQGLLGLALFLYGWVGIIKSAPRHVRYCGLILAIYSFSENNLDNFPFMSLFILCLSAAGPSSEAEC